jgi:hypoxanthine phosphoribosyltransferase
MNFRSVNDLRNSIFKNIAYLPRDIDLVVGIPRSGMLPATLMALYMNTLLTDFESYLKGECFNVGRTRKKFVQSTKKSDISRKVIIIDDSSCTGSQLKMCKKKLATVLPNNIDKIIWCVPYITKRVASNVDIYFEIIEYPRFFEWNMMSNKCLDSCCMDIDDVLTVSGNRMDPPTILPLDQLKPLYLPTRKIPHLVSCRLEKEREITEKWLREHNVEYGELHLMNYNTKVERRKDNKYGEYKAKVFMDTGMKLFIESSERQAKKIYHITKKPVLCVDTMVLYK